MWNEATKRRGENRKMRRKSTSERRLIQVKVRYGIPARSQPGGRWDIFINPWVHVLVLQRPELLSH